MKSILLYSVNRTAAAAEVKKLGGYITQIFSANIFSAALPEGKDKKKLKNATANIPHELDDLSQLAVEAWNEYGVKTGEHPFIGISWDAHGYGDPLLLDNDELTSRAPAVHLLSTNTPTSLFMIGSVAVGIVFVSGPGSLAFSNEQIKKITGRVQNGLQFLATAEPRAQLSFNYDIRQLTVNVQSGPITTFESAEAPWRNAALQQMGFTASRDGSKEYVQTLQNQKKTRWAYVVYFTMYPLHHFAYAELEKIVIHHEEGTWRSHLISEIFAHETCHIFGAADESGGTCNCTTLHGHLNVPNGNCRSCAAAFTPCLMEQGRNVLCRFTRRQIGWEFSVPATSAKHTPRVKTKSKSKCK